jgi:arylsulfatase A-like enzyme
MLWEFIFISGAFLSGNKIEDNKKSPNVLLLTIESLRYDFIGHNGNARIKTPYLDSFSEEGVVFDSYFVQAPYTTSSLSTLLTGFYPYIHGARMFGQKPKSEFQPFIKDLAEMGYAVRTDGSYFAELFPDFSHFEYGTIKKRSFSSMIKFIFNRMTELQYIMNDISAHFLPDLSDRYCFGSRTAMRQTSRLLRNIRIHKNRKWFLWTHFINHCHWPYDAPLKYVKMYDENEGLKKISWSVDDLEKLNNDSKKITNQIQASIENIYSAEVSCIDKQIGLILNQIKMLKLYDNTMIIITSDHGELLGKTGYIGHGKFLRDELIHVPLIVHLGSFEYLKGGTRIDDFIEEVDIAPTILDVCGLSEKENYDGKSFVNLLNLKDWKRNSVYSEMIRDKKFFFACYREKEFKLIWNSTLDRYELYDLVVDPGENENISHDKPDISSEMERKFLNFLGYTSMNALIPNLEIKVDKDMEEKLKALGYIK